MEQAQQEYEEAYEDEDAEDLLADLRESCRYVIEPGLTFCALAKKVSENTFQREKLKRAFNDIENSIMVPRIRTTSSKNIVNVV
jgi:type I restriction enzyme M protein